MEPLLSSNFQSFSAQGGLAQITASPGGAKLQFALAYVNQSLAPPPLSPPSAALPGKHLPGKARLAKAEENSEYFCFIADEGTLYPEALAADPRFADLPLARLLLVKTSDARESWRTSLEAIQSGLFAWVLVRPSRGCDATQLRKLQLSAERTSTKVLLLNTHKLPHWMCKVSVEAPAVVPSAESTRMLHALRGSPASNAATAGGSLGTNPLLAKLLAAHHLRRRESRSHS